MHARLPLRLVAVGALIASAAQAQGSQAAQAPQVSLTGVVYTQFLYQLKDSLGAGHQNQFSTQRAYINMIGRFTGGIFARVTADIAPSGTGSQFYRLKFAYAAWTPTNSALTYKLGLLHTPYVDWEETLWDYRMQGAIAVDRNGYMTAADYGVGVDGHWNGEQVNAQVTIVNGEGYGGATGDDRKDFQARVSVRLQPTNDASRVGGLRATLYAGVGKYSQSVGGGIRNRFLGTVSYRTQQFTVAGEYVGTNDAGVQGSIISAFGVYHFSPPSKVAAIARVDILDPNTNVATNKQTRVIAGLSYQLTPNVRLLADADLLSYEGGSTPLQDATRSRALFQAQFTF